MKDSLLFTDFLLLNGITDRGGCFLEPQGLGLFSFIDFNIHVLYWHLHSKYYSDCSIYSWKIVHLALTNNPSLILSPILLVEGVQFGPQGLGLFFHLLISACIHILFWHLHWDIFSIPRSIAGKLLIWH